MGDNLKNRTFDFLCFVTITAGVLLSIYGIWSPYSYWWDELYSVISSSSPLDTMFWDYIIPDVHPPLYQLILKGWISIFSDGEAATRSLSLLFALSALIVLMKWGRKQLTPSAFLGAVVFLSTNYLFIYYAQETRAYAMMLFFSTLLTTRYYEIMSGDNDRKSVGLTMALAIVLSLTHYFGLIYAGVILIIIFLNAISRGNVKMGFQTAAAGVICLIWPSFHYVLGNIGQKAGGNFWLQSDGWQTTISIAGTSFFPQISQVFQRVFSIDSQYLDAGVFLVILIFMAIAAGFMKGNMSLAENKQKGDVRAIIAAILLFLIVITLIDMIIPMSNMRNYIVLLPAVSILFGVFAQNTMRFGRALICILILIFAMSNIIGFIISFNSTDGRIPTQNHKDASGYIAECLENQDYHVYYCVGLHTVNEMRQKKAEYYIDRIIPDRHIKVMEILPGDLEMLERPCLLLFQHNADLYDETLETLTKSGILFDTYIPEQRWRGAMVIKIEQP